MRKLGLNSPLFYNKFAVISGKFRGGGKMGKNHRFSPENGLNRSKFGQKIPPGGKPGGRGGGKWGDS